MTSILRIASKNAQRAFVDTVRRGGIVVYPTDTVYGIGCDILNHKALMRLARMKGRSTKKPFPILASDVVMVEKIAVIPGWIYPLPQILWPGPWTFVLPARRKFHRSISYQGTVGIRIPDHLALRRLIAKLGHPIVGTSANRAGEQPTRSARGAQKIFAQTPDRPDLILDGGILRGKPSIVIDVSAQSLRILRK